MSKVVKIAVVTGASRGIGFAVANELAGRGYSLGLTARSPQEIEKAAEEICGKFPDVKIITSAFDVVDGGAVKNFVERVSAELGNISVLVNNAGYYKTGTSSLSIDEAQKSINVNFLAAVRFMKAVLPVMKKSRIGYIFNIASICGVEAFADTGVYSASKFALVGYSSALAQELAPKRIKVTAICPGWVNTQLASEAPMKPEKMIQTSDIALTIGYLLSLGPAASVREIVIRC
jgi:3-oxoacyl-[acyl-carrier protein] reductase